MGLYIFPHRCSGRTGRLVFWGGDKKLKKRLTGWDGLDRLLSCRFVLAEQKAGL